MSGVAVNYVFPHNYELKTLGSYSLVDPAETLHQFPTRLEEGDRLGIYLQVAPKTSPAWIGFFALGFESQHAVRGVFSCPDPDWLCAVSGGYAYAVDAANPQRWLQIEQRKPVAQRADIPDWAMYHPHCQRAQVAALDSLYVATDHLQLPGLSVDVPGAGFFRRYHPSLCLSNTDTYQSRRLWRLPPWIYPAPGKIPMTYHASPVLWRREDGYTLLRTAGRGQEFVLDCEEYPEAVEWAGSIIEGALDFCHRISYYMTKCSHLVITLIWSYSHNERMGHIGKSTQECTRSKRGTLKARAAR